MLTCEVGKAWVAAAQCWSSQISDLAAVVPIHDSGPSRLQTDAREMRELWHLQLVMSAGFEYADEQEVIDWLRWAQLSMKV